MALVQRHGDTTDGRIEQPLSAALDGGGGWIGLVAGVGEVRQLPATASDSRALLRGALFLWGLLLYRVVALIRCRKGQHCPSF